MSEMQTLAYLPAALVSFGFTGALVGAYCTTNGRDGTGDGSVEAFVSGWRYEGMGQLVD